MTTLVSGIKLAVAASLSQTPALGTTSHLLTYGQNISFTDGSGLAQANKLYEQTYTITASSSTTIDLTSLTDALGNALVFSKIKCLMIYASTTNTNNVLVGNATNAWFSWCDATTDVVKVLPGGIMCLVAPNIVGFPVTASTAMNLKLANSSSGTSVVCDLVLIGA